MRAFGIVCILFLGASSAFAQTSSQTDWQSERYHQAPNKVFELTPGFTYASKLTKARTAASYKITTTEFSPNLRAEYGWNSYFSTGIAFNYTLGTVQIDNPAGSNSKVTGFSEPLLYVRTRYPLPFGYLLFGVNLTAAMEKGKTELNGDTNISQGETSISPYLGLEAMLANGLVLGATVSMDVSKGERTNTTSAGIETKTKGGIATTFSLYGEYPLEPVRLGLGLDYITTTSTRDSVAGATEVDQRNANGTTLIRAYVPYQVLNDVLILPEINYAMLAYSDTTYSYDTRSSVIFKIAARVSY